MNAPACHPLPRCPSPACAPPHAGQFPWSPPVNCTPACPRPHCEQHLMQHAWACQASSLCQLLLQDRPLVPACQLDPCLLQAAPVTQQVMQHACRSCCRLGQLLLQDSPLVPACMLHDLLGDGAAPSPLSSPAAGRSSGRGAPAAPLTAPGRTVNSVSSSCSLHAEVASEARGTTAFRLPT